MDFVLFLQHCLSLHALSFSDVVLRVELRIHLLYGFSGPTAAGIHYVLADEAVVVVGFLCVGNVGSFLGKRALEDSLYFLQQDAVLPFDFGVAGLLDAIHFLGQGRSTCWLGRL